ncbi:hypothetical protein TorRG33x02_321090, partial [Trema orientale]
CFEGKNEAKVGETHVEQPLEKEAITHDLPKEKADTQKKLNASTEGQSAEAAEDIFKEVGPPQVNNNLVILKFNAGALCQNTKPPS